MPTDAKTLLRATLTPPQDNVGALLPPSTSGRFATIAPVRASYASRKPLRSTEYTTPFATATGGPQCAPSATGPIQRSEAFGADSVERYLGADTVEWTDLAA